jgi:hypothetical protein
MSTIFELGMQTAAQAQQDVTFFAPMVGQISCTVLNHTYPNRAKLSRSPKGRPSCAGVLRHFNA